MSEGTGFYQIESISHLLMVSVFEKTEFIENRHWKQIITYLFKPLILHCPSDSLDKQLCPFISTFFNYSRQKMEQEWTKLIGSGEVIHEKRYRFNNDWKSFIISVQLDENDLEDVSNEIIEERILRQFTRALFDMIHSLFAIIPGLQESQMEFQNTHLVEFILASTVRYKSFSTFYSPYHSFNL